MLYQARVVALGSPFALRGKIILQDLWKQRYDWDQEVDRCFLKQIAEWTEEFAQFFFLVCFPHRLGISNSDNDVVVHLFTDASERGYGSFIYFVVGSISHLGFAKAKVVPLKTQTIARLELQAAFLGARYFSLLIKE